MNIPALLQQMTLLEKAQFVCGKNNWETLDLPHYDIPSIVLADGPHGLRKEDPAHARQNKGSSTHATCFPAAVSLACTWDEAAVQAMGKALGAESKSQGVDVLLGPGVNIQRSPLCGRNFEYFSEDPVLAGTLGAAYLKGVQQTGVSGCLKHFAANNQETLRMSIDAEVAPRALHEVYLKPFEIAVQTGKPHAVMCSYNKLNGEYTGQNKTLLTDILRDTWGFSGAVISDWGAVDSREKSIAAGLDLEMPAMPAHAQELVAAVQAGTLSQTDLDKAVANCLALVEKHTQPVEIKPVYHKALAQKLSEESIVLLENDGVLPLTPKANIAVIGQAARHPRYQGSGSSYVNPPEVTTFISAMAAHGAAYINEAQGYKLDTEDIDFDLEEQAARFARTAETVVYFMALPEHAECESYDRDTLALPGNQTHLLEKLLTANENVVVVLSCGAPVETPWAKRVRALLYTGLGGQETGEAVYRVLYGIVNPAGRLAQTWPLSIEDTPCARYFPMGPRVVNYQEGLYVGYRYYDKVQKGVAYPFGYGLSYTQFLYHAISVTQPDDGLTVHVTLTNTGERDGAEVVQVYLANPGSQVHRPQKTLVGFRRIFLKAGESATVDIAVLPQALTVFDGTENVCEAGEYLFTAGTLTAKTTLKGATLPPDESAYHNFTDNAFPTQWFYAEHTRPQQDNTPPQKGSYTMHTTLGQMQKSATARSLSALAKQLTKRQMHFSRDDKTNECATEACVENLPFKNIAMNSGGKITKPFAEALLEACNGKRSAAALLATLFQK